MAEDKFINMREAVLFIKSLDGIKWEWLNIKKLAITKQMDAPGFRNNNWYIDGEMLDWLEENKDLIIEEAEDSLTALKKKRLSKQIEKDQIDIDKAKELVLDKDKVVSDVKALAQTLDAAHEKIFEIELPDKIVGLNRSQAVELCKLYRINLYQVIKDMLKNYVKLK